MGGRDSTSTQLYDARNNPITALDPAIESVLGNIAGHATERKFGFNNDVDAGVEETVWSSGGRFVPLDPGTAETLTVVSTSTADGGVTDTGALTISVRGVDINLVDITETIILNGTTPVISTSLFFMVNTMRVESAGSGRKNAGDINVTSTSSATVQGQIPTGYCTSQQMIFCVPAGFHAVMETFTISSTKIGVAGTAPLVTARLHELGYGSGAPHFGTDAIIFEETFDTSVIDEVHGEGINHVIFEPGEVIEFTAITTTNNTVVHGHAEILLVTEGASPHV